MKKGGVCIMDLTIDVGHEQHGKRPAILIADTKTDIVIAIPLTANLSALKFPYTLAILPDKHNNLDCESVALIFHIRAIDRSRIIKITGKINRNFQKKIDKMLKEMLGL